MQDRNKVLDALYLFNQSADHRLYTLIEFNHYALFPLIHRKAYLFYTDNRPSGFVTWAWLTPDEEREFLAERWMPDESVWARPDEINPEYSLWGIDFIAPYGNALQVMRGMMKHSQTVLGQRTKANWRRFKSPNEIHSKRF